MFRLRLSSRFMARDKKIVSIDKYLGLSKEEANGYSVQPKSKKELLRVIDKAVSKLGIYADLNFIDVSKITDMSELFCYSAFNGDISFWNVSNVENMHYMFYNSSFKGDISYWRVSKVKDMFGMFEYSVFNGDISDWDVSDVTGMGRMFAGSKFNGDISDWDVSNVRSMVEMFDDTEFNRDISKWVISRDCDTRGMFKYSPLETRYGIDAERLKY